MLVRRCAKPDQKEFNKIIMATGMGFVLMGFIGFFVKVCGSCELSLHRHVRVARYTLHSPPPIFFQTDTAAVHARSFISSCSFPSTTSSSPTCSRQRRARMSPPGRMSHRTGGTFSTFASVNPLSCACSNNKMGTWDCRLLWAEFPCTYFQIRSVTRQIECSAASNGVREPPDTIPAHYTPGPVCVYNLLLSALTAQETRNEGTGEHDSDLVNVRCPFPAGPVIWPCRPLRCHWRQN